MGLAIVQYVVCIDTGRAVLYGSTPYFVLIIVTLRPVPAYSVLRKIIEMAIISIAPLAL